MQQFERVSAIMNEKKIDSYRVDIRNILFQVLGLRLLPYTYTEHAVYNGNSQEKRVQNKSLFACQMHPGTRRHETGRHLTSEQPRSVRHFNPAYSTSLGKPAVLLQPTIQQKTTESVTYISCADSTISTSSVQHVVYYYHIHFARSAQLSVDTIASATIRG